MYDCMVKSGTGSDMKEGLLHNILKVIMVSRESKSASHALAIDCLDLMVRDLIP